ncbi:hypothetical protein [Halobellus rufus]|uniref:hypothetical protein n=1 Tax=Halobellus rufus TaxID=1448860 RepID=UPI0006797BC2|nr:hypothetical protein [Halobellus rufus]
MGFFGSTSTVDGKARTVLGDLSEDDSPFEILRAVDQQAGDDVDRDDVVQKMRTLDEDVDQKLGAIEGDDIDQKDMRDAAGTIAERSALSQPAAMELISAMVDAIDRMDPSVLIDAFDSATAGEHVNEDELDQDGLDQRAQDEPDADATADADQKAGTHPMSDNTNPDSTDPDAGGDPDVDQKQDDGNDDGGDAGGGVLEMLNDDARETVEEFAELAGKDPEECVEEVLGVGGGGGGGGGDPNAAAAPDQNGQSPAAGQADVDQMLENLNLNERVADAVTSEEVINAMAGEVAQKMADDDEFADTLVETVDQKGDFATTDDTVVTAPSNDSETVGDAGAITGGDGE